MGEGPREAAVVTLHLCMVPGSGLFHMLDARTHMHVHTRTHTLYIDILPMQQVLLLL